MSTEAAAAPSPYNDDFYRSQVDGSVRSARIVLKALFDYIHPISVLDLGCGRGGWLTAAGDLGATTLVGRDGPWVDPSKLLSDRIEFEACDMAADIPVDRRFDLAMSIEVAEHLPPSRAGIFVDTLCRASDVVLFGAAIPRQGGTGHVNEQPQSYWISLFEQRGYECFDIVRSLLWDNQDVRWWYRQNTFLFVNPAAPESIVERVRMKAVIRPIVDSVHPALLEEVMERPHWRVAASLLRKAIVQRIRR